MIPQSLAVNNSTSSSAVKRQRSADGRDPQGATDITSRHAPLAGKLKANLRIPAYLEKSKSEISATFQDIEWKQRFRLFHAMTNPQTSPFRVDRSELVVSRNRYGNVQPWDQSRVKLQNPIDGSDYVNASPIVLKTKIGSHNTILQKHGIEDDANAIYQETNYIASQGPKVGQTSHFWHMVHQQTTGDQGVVVMLTQCEESGKEKCAQYFPLSMTHPSMTLPLDEQRQGLDSSSANSDSKSATLASAAVSPIELTLLSCENDPVTRCTVRVVDVRVGEVTKKIHHYAFNAWADFGKPEAEDRVALLKMMRKTREIAKGSPRVVHCSAGVGRTGTFIALDFLIREIEEGRFLDNTLYPYLRSPTNLAHPDHQSLNVVTPTVETWGKSGPVKVQTPTTEEGFPIDGDNQTFKDDLIYRTVNTLREQRMMMVMNELQFSFLYEVIREVFLDRYKTRPEGATVKAAADSGFGTAVNTDDQAPKSKAARLEGQGITDDEVSEAETEIIIDDKNNETAASAVDDGVDPYAAVAPVHIWQGNEKTEQ